MEKFCYYFLSFFIYSIIGYISEVLYVYIYSKKWVNRGFLNGPYVPIYGMGGLLVTFLLTGYYNDPIVVFIMALIICSVLEYFTSWLMEKMFHNRWWDYSDYKYNVNGRVCLKNSVLFGIGGLIFIYAGNPLIYLFLHSIDIKYQEIATFILVGVLLTDLTISMFEAFRVNNISNHLDTILNEYTKNRNIKLNRIKTRLLDAFPNLVKNERIIKRLKALKKDFSKRKKL